MSEDNLDYATGEPRRHHKYYIPSGDIVLQVQNAIFKVHRFFLAQHSNALRDMLGVPQGDGSRDGTDERPLILPDDAATGWELVFRAIYRTDPVDSINYTFAESLDLLRIAHKYCMDSFERPAVKRLQVVSTLPEYVELMVASKLISSDDMYAQALEGLARNRRSMSLDQARRIGVDALFDVVNHVCFNCRSGYAPICPNCKAHR